MPDRQTILFVHSIDVRTPLGSTVPYYLSRRASSDHDVHVLCRDLAGPRETDDTDVTYHTLSVGNVRIASNVLYLVLSAVVGAYLGLRLRFDVVYSFQYCTLQGWLSAVASGAGFVVGIQSVPTRQYRDFTRASGDGPGPVESVGAKLGAAYTTLVGYVLQRADGVTCLTELIRDLSASTFGIDLRGARVIPLGVDTDEFDPSRYPTTGTRGDPWQVVYVGTVRELRGLDTVIRAVARSDYEIHLHLAGSGPERDVQSLRQTARDCGVSDEITWHGVVPHENVPALLSRADVAVSPLSDVEAYRVSFPAKVLEYMAAGVVIVATDLEPHRRLLTHRENGYLYDGTESGFRQTLEYCLENPQEHPTIERRARKTAQAYDWETVYRRHHEVIVRAAGR